MDEPQPETRVCSVCLRVLEASTKYFQRRPNGNCFFRQCKSCRRKARDKKHKLTPKEEQVLADKQLIASAKLLKNTTLKTIAHMTSQHKISRVPHLAEIFEQLMHCFGGAANYAQKMHQDYENAEEGGMVRCQLHKLVSTYAVKSSEMGAAQKPTDMMSEEELNRELDDLERRRMQLRITAGLIQDVDQPPEGNDG